MATAERAVGHGTVAEAAAGLGAKFNSAVVIFARLHCAVEQRAFRKTGNLAVDDGEIFRRPHFTECIGTFRAQTIVIRRIDAAIRNHRVAAAINVYAVTICVHRHVVHGQVVAAGDENRKMAAVENRDVPDQNIFAELQRDGFIAQAHRHHVIGIKVGGDTRVTLAIGAPFLQVAAHAIQDTVRAHETAAVDGAVAGDENIRQIFAPNQTVVKIAMAAVLKTAECVRLRFVIGVHVLRRTENGRAGVNKQMNVALQMNRAAQISSGGNQNGAAAGIRRGVDGFVDGRTVERRAIASGAEVADVEKISGGLGVRDAEEPKHPRGKFHCGHDRIFHDNFIGVQS